jgi:hypothetical protein
LFGRQGQVNVILIIPDIPTESSGDLEPINRNADHLNRETEWLYPTFIAAKIIVSRSSKSFTPGKSHGS